MRRWVVNRLPASCRASVPFLLSLLAAALAGCETLYPTSIEGLDQPDSMTVYALAPDVTAGTDEQAERVQGIPVKTKLVIKDHDARRHLVAEVTHAMNEHTDPSGCWKPRYAVRATEGRHAFELLFSFECNNMTVAGEPTPHPISTRAQLAVLSALSEH